jgi:hypothetical protein
MFKIQSPEKVICCSQSFSLRRDTKSYTHDQKQSFISLTLKGLPWALVHAAGQSDTSQRTDTRAISRIRTGAVKLTLQVSLYAVSRLKDSSRGQGTGHVQTFQGGVPVKHNSVLPSH